MTTDTIPAERLRCNVGGDYIESVGRPTVYREPCTAAPTHRYREIACPDQPWGFRCSTHAAWLDREHVLVEPLAGENAGDRS